MKSMRSAVLAAALAVTTQAALAQVTWDFPGAYPVNSFHTQNMQQFADDVAKATDGKLKMTIHAGGSLYKGNEIKRAVQTRQVQIGEFFISSAANENPIYGVDAIPFLATSYADAKKLSKASRPALEKLMASQGMKLLYVAPWPGQSLFSLNPVSNSADLEGTKMRSNNPATNRVAQLLKAQPANIQLSELGQALATGAVDNFWTSSASGVENKLYEQANYFYEVNAWLPKNAVVVGTKAFEALDKDTQEAVLKAAKAAEERVWGISEQKDKEYLELLAKNGVEVSKPSAEFKAELKAIGETMTREWLQTAGEEGKEIIDAYHKM